MTITDSKHATGNIFVMGDCVQDYFYVPTGAYSDGTLRYDITSRETKMCPHGGCADNAYSQIDKYIRSLPISSQTRFDTHRWYNIYSKSFRSYYLDKAQTKVVARESYTSAFTEIQDKQLQFPSMGGGALVHLYVADYRHGAVYPDKFRTLCNHMQATDKTFGVICMNCKDPNHTRKLLGGVITEYPERFTSDTKIIITVSASDLDRQYWHKDQCYAHVFEHRPDLSSFLGDIYLVVTKAQGATRVLVEDLDTGYTRDTRYFPPLLFGTPCENTIGAGDVFSATLFCEMILAARTTFIADMVSCAHHAAYRYVYGVDSGVSPRLNQRTYTGWGDLIPTLHRPDYVTLRTDVAHLAVTNGCFDAVHLGHKATFDKMKGFDDVDCNVVLINDDVSSQQLKGPGRPFLTWDQRAASVAALIQPTRYERFVCGDIPTAALYNLDSTDVSGAISELLSRSMGIQHYLKGAEYSEDSLLTPELRKQIAHIDLVPMVEGVSTTKILEQKGITRASVGQEAE